MILPGFATMNIRADDVTVAVAWHTEFLGVMSNPHDLDILARTGPA